MTQMILSFALGVGVLEERFMKGNVGRPPKPDHVKENPVAIRLSKEFILAIQVEADKHKMGWQTFMKDVVARKIRFTSEWEG
jgi:hypothetical protein